MRGKCHLSGGLTSTCVLIVVVRREKYPVAGLEPRPQLQVKRSGLGQGLRPEYDVDICTSTPPYPGRLKATMTLRE